MRLARQDTGSRSLSVLLDHDQGARPSRGLRGTSIWLIVCLLVLLWWAGTYSSLVEVLAEWQFVYLGRYYPSLTVSLAVLILTLPIAAVVGWQRRRRRERLGDAADPRLMMARAIRSAERTQLFFAGLAVVATLIALCALISMLWLPSDNGSVRTVAGVEGSVQPQGAAAYARPFRIGRVARIEENVGLARRVMYVAPVYLGREHGDDSFLTTVEPSLRPPLRFAPIKSGVLIERGLPRELTNLYRAAGITVPDRSYLLMRDNAAVRWRSLVLSIQIGLLALLTVVVALLFRRQSRRLRRLLAEDTSVTTP